MGAMALRNASNEVAVMTDYMQLVPRGAEATETAALLVEQLENLAEMETALPDRNLFATQQILIWKNGQGA